MTLGGMGRIPRSKEAAAMPTPPALSTLLGTQLPATARQVFAALERARHEVDGAATVTDFDDFDAALSAAIRALSTASRELAALRATATIARDEFDRGTPAPDLNTTAALLSASTVLGRMRHMLPDGASELHCLEPLVHPCEQTTCPTGMGDFLDHLYIGERRPVGELWSTSWTTPDPTTFLESPSCDLLP